MPTTTERRQLTVACERERLLPRPVTHEEERQVARASRGERFDEEHYERVLKERRF